MQDVPTAPISPVLASAAATVTDPALLIVGLLTGDAVWDAAGLVGLELVDGGLLLVGAMEVEGLVEGTRDIDGEKVGAQLFDARQVK